MRRSYILPITVLLVLILYHIYARNDEMVNYVGDFNETCRAGTRLRAFKKVIESTWDYRGIAKLFDSVNLETPFGESVDYISVKTTSKEHFKERFGKCKFKVTGNSRLKYDYYYHYIHSPKHRQDDEPIFIFDSTFADKGKKMRELLNEYTIPEWFDEDLFDCLSEEERPNFRWLLLSTRGAGTSLHVDPVCTSAWNTMIQGKKRWILFPPKTFKSEDDFDSIMRGAEWFLKEYPKYKHLPHKDIIQLPGETVFLPSDWWHITVNFEDSIAVTQNILTPNNFDKAREQVYDALPKVYLKWIRILNENPEKYCGKIEEVRTLDSIDYSSEFIESESDCE